MNTHPGRTALGHYRTTDAYGAASGDPLQLVLRLLDGAIDRIATARGHMRRREIGAKGEAIGKAIGIIDGLRAVLDAHKGGQIAANLEALYDYMSRRLVEANFQNDERRLDEVIELLEEIRSGWLAIARNREPAARVADTAGA
jgi:flagellar protein FliS